VRLLPPFVPLVSGRMAAAVSGLPTAAAVSGLASLSLSLSLPFPPPPSPIISTSLFWSMLLGLVGSLMGPWLSTRFQSQSKAELVEV